MRIWDVINVINQYMFWNFDINHVENIQWRAEYCVSDWKILRLHLKNFNTEKKSIRDLNISCELLK